ncbi:hypothetical protein JMJ35_010581 [Cladonia borealis]|uniref:2,6-dihydroxypyridine 3-monooxygenase substrate binding domain-containing protein n=1 Tax=Cladonia borealis TaxID=184061 RepID=A0AA39QR43_9LECA|nr:hypothetical protein JMJ35_010581 [Cladonia borealis]
MRDNPLNVVIVGGSLAGLMHGVMIKRLGHNELLRKIDHCDGEYALLSPGIQYVDTDLNVTGYRKVTQMLTSWNVLYYRLRANFDGFQSDYCTKSREELEEQGEAVYNIGKRVTDVTYTDCLVTVKFDDLINGGRGHLQPDLRPYAGYLKWRGTVAEKDVTEETKALFNEKVTLNVMDHSYIVLYTIPGESGSFKPGERLLNFVWYCNCPEDSSEFKNAMTDIDGHFHRSTLPPGKMREDVWAR